ncbi:lipocalin-like domain-containing protein [Pseudodonghicola flavimaris]|uniref:Lipocalin-like domain-containing protein n=1 Tax=Pseudodonghicola flavimaris TaxID=3050036 RepID=A0ABT7F1D9_9RHOB|nr:lipocalin-like domain-containing protein [Pseudodonghicola flavimaris]MDK3018320.1 lipocalin-like domain-containing protein [Pseudodonghicola flavimaris]
MPAKLILGLCMAILFAAPLRAQGYAGLGSTAEAGFATPEHGRPLVFPRDHGPHPEFRIEWWYLTATLAGPDGTPYGIQWTLFRSALAPGEAEGWQSPQIWMGHAAATSARSHHFAERLGRGGIGQAGVRTGPFEAWIDDWRMAGDDGLRALRLTARGGDFAYDLHLNAEGPLVLQGDRGYSVKSADGQASYYYSQPSYRVTGTLALPSGPVAVTGQGWLDREWSSQPLAADQSGWDWFSLSFETGAKLMGFRLRGTRGDFTSGTWIAADGTATALTPGALRAEPLESSDAAGPEVPVRWRLQLPERDLDIEIAALNPAAWMGTRFAYWEGPVQIEGSHRGRGYLEMTGYDD